MAKSKTSAKRARTAEANRLRNKSFKSKLKTSIKKFEETIDQTEVDVETARENLLQATSLLDKSINKGILHKNTAARKKSALSKKFNKIAE